MSAEKIDRILSVSARSWDPVMDPKGYEQVTSLAAAAALTVPADSRVAWIQAEAQTVRWRDDGTNPSTGVGMVLVAGDSMWYTGDLTALRFIETSASAKLNVSYYGSI